jgi:hypothetical protein
VVIGSFQILNLIRNKVPFMLVGISTTDESQEKLLHDLKNVLNPMERVYLDRVLQLTQATPEEFLKKLQADKISQSHPIVFISSPDDLSKKFAQHFQEQNFINAYYVLGGSAELHLE